jgi:hypothetical protein
MLPKSTYPEYRTGPMNLVPVCAWHHTMDERVNAHGPDRASRIRFELCVKRVLPKQYEWVVAHSRRPLISQTENEDGTAIVCVANDKETCEDKN